MVNVPTSSISHFVNSQFVNIDQTGIDKVGIDEVGSWQSGKLTKWELTKWEDTTLSTYGQNTVIRFFSSGKFSSKKYSRKKIFGQTKLNENILQVASVQKRWHVKRRQLVVLETTTYTRIYGQEQLGKCWCVARSQPTRKNFCHKIIFA